MKNNRPDSSGSSLNADKICFGLNRATDEASLKIFLQKFTDGNLLETLIPRLTDSEINDVLDFLSNLMHKHLNKKEYHRLFLKI